MPTPRIHVDRNLTNAERMRRLRVRQRDRLARYESALQRIAYGDPDAQRLACDALQIPVDSEYTDR